MSMIDVCLLTLGTHPFDQMIGGTTMEGQSSECHSIVPSLSLLHGRHKLVLRMELFFPIHDLLLVWFSLRGYLIPVSMSIYAIAFFGQNPCLTPHLVWDN
jgi:hypothetical protein